MELLIFAIYIYAGAKANSFIKHNVFGIRTVLVFNLGNFILDKIILSFLIGWASIPIAIVLYFFGVGRKQGENHEK